MSLQDIQDQSSIAFPCPGFTGEALNDSKIARGQSGAELAQVGPINAQYAVHHLLIDRADCF